MAPKLKNKNRDKQIESKKKKRNVESADESSDYEEKVPGSVELKKIIEPLEKNELLKGTRISFFNEHENNFLIVDATIQCSKIFRIPKTRVTGKLNRDNKSNNDFIKSLLKIHEEQRDLKDLREIINNPSERTQHSSENNEIISNPSLESGSNIGIVSNKEFTNFLRSELERKFKDDPNKTLGYYQTNYPNRILEIKIKFVLQHLSFREA
ncbi:hypothetical protein BpHYR1_003269 [Brachionus plicatilis]|uniref:Uncharacterized protein n=1 Tax=Brachionus plicatilis TaxID=10195 RepID=A0A3M7R9V0_BRAPC|nr:hypothetical protein BpHYR1_003269 [Brachionus plicatilis]